MASGEGYGTALLAQIANSATGVELTQDAADHAVASYAAPTLHYFAPSHAPGPCCTGRHVSHSARGSVEHLPILLKQPTSPPCSNCSEPQSPAARIACQ
jgi:hypothetical protein